MFDVRLDFVGDFTLPSTRIALKGVYAKKKFVIRHYQGDKLRGLLLCNALDREVELARDELRESLGK